MTNYTCCIGNQEKPRDCTRELQDLVQLRLWWRPGTVQAHSLPSEHSHRGHNHPCLLSWVLLSSQSRLPGQLQEGRHLKSEWELEFELRVNFTSPFQPALFPFHELHSRATVTVLLLSVMQKTDKSAFVKAKLSPGVASPPQNTFPITNWTPADPVPERMNLAGDRCSTEKHMQNFEGTILCLL